MFFYSLGNAQRFSLLGNANQLDPVTYMLTDDLKNQKGMITNYYPLDLTKDFTLSFQLNFGVDDYGADGFAFILSKICNPNLVDGGGLGADHILNSIIVEFDTYDNDSPYDDDPTIDHIGIYKDGLVSRISGRIMDLNSGNPACMFSDYKCLFIGNDVEDGKWYNVDIKWTYINSTTQKIEVFFDGVLRQSSTRDHIADRFLGQTKAFWSVTAATGDRFNKQMIKVSGENNNFDYSCGSSFQLVAPDLGSNYVWTPAPDSFNDNVANYTSSTTQTITCTYTDFCNVNRSVDFNITVPPIVPIFSFGTDFCQGEVVPNLPNTSDNGLAGTWSPAVISNISSGNYIFTPSSCGSPKTIPVTIRPKPVTTNIKAN